MIYICIPALDEARTVGVLLWKVRRVMAEFPRDYHLLVLDDGSTDGTAEVLEPYARVLPLTVLRHERTRGYAASLERLVREAVRLSTHPRRDVAVVLQGDFTEPPEEIPALIRKLEGGADVVGTTPAGEPAASPRPLRWSRRLLPWILPRAAFPPESGDPLSGLRAYRVSVLKRALAEGGEKPLLSRSGWAANAELLSAAAPHVRRADAAPVALRYGVRERASRFHPWRTAAELWELRRTAPRLAPPAPPAEGQGRTKKPKREKDEAHVS